VRTYDRRIAFLVSYQTLIPHGGIGQFAKSFIELMDSHNIKVDIITDKKLNPENNEFIKALGLGKFEPPIVITPDESLPYTDHSAIFMYGDSYCFERMANFRNAIVKALSTNLYDAIVCNTYETVQVASTMGLEDVIQIIAYTHLESQIFKDTKNPFLYNVNELMRKQLELNGIDIATQSKFNQLEFENAWHCPIPITEKSLLEEHHTPREGVLFIGRWEEGKNPELYLDLIEQTKLPAKVMTSANGAKKFEERLKKMNVKYDIRVGILGKEKVDFITSSRIAFNPSTVESYGMAFYEQHIQLPTFVLENQRWTNNFNKDYFLTTNKKNMVKDVLDMYNYSVDAKLWYESGSLKHAQDCEKDVFHKWNDCFNSFKIKQSNSSTAKILTYDTTSYSDYVKDLGRSILCIDDIRSILTNKHKFNTVIYTDKNTYLSKEVNYEPQEQVTGLALFEEL
jgi:glycosyltransferase involved in cell wall biosynthesis